MARPRKFTNEQIAQALEKSGGLYKYAAKELGCDRRTISEYVERDAQLAEAAKGAKESMKDTAEWSLFRAIEAGEAWAVKFYLATQAKDRGYVERQEITGANGSAFTVEFVPADG